jgi:hypothetical protein
VNALTVRAVRGARIARRAGAVLLGAVLVGCGGSGTNPSTIASSAPATLVSPGTTASLAVLGAATPPSATFGLANSAEEVTVTLESGTTPGTYGVAATAGLPPGAPASFSTALSLPSATVRIPQESSTTAGPVTTVSVLPSAQTSSPAESIAISISSGTVNTSYSAFGWCNGSAQWTYLGNRTSSSTGYQSYSSLDLTAAQPSSTCYYSIIPVLSISNTLPQTVAQGSSTAFTVSESGYGGTFTASVSGAGATLTTGSCPGSSSVASSSGAFTLCVPSGALVGQDVVVTLTDAPTDGSAVSSTSDTLTVTAGS